MLNLDLHRKPIGLIGATLLTVVVFLLDLATGREVILAVYYMLPILLAAWTGGLLWGVIFSVTAFLCIVVTAARIGHPFSQPFYFWFDVSNILLAFLIVAFLAARLRQSWDIQHALARIDPLTGIPNRKTFYESVATEINRQARVQLPFALLYLDCDNFKQVNDEHGHKEGDKLLSAVAHTLAASLRKSDVVARLGGDEFGVLLPATDAPESLIVGRALQDKLRQTMAAGGWAVSVSIGIAVYETPPASAAVAIDEADRVMYEVKQNGKNACLQRVVT